MNSGRASRRVPSIEDYDEWYQRPKGRALFASELACLKPLFPGLQRPSLEVGMGTGRFAHKLGVDFGVDPSSAALALAGARGVKVARAVGEALPFADATFGVVLIVLTLCFVSDPIRLLLEAHRVLKPSGGLVLGELPREGSWASWYARRGAEGDPSYAGCHFYPQEEVESMLVRAGFRVQVRRSSLFQPPNLGSYVEETPRDGYQAQAGFVAMLARRFPGSDQGSTFASTLENPPEQPNSGAPSCATRYRH